MFQISSLKETPSMYLESSFKAPIGKQAWIILVLGQA